jgi:hypothetical protein
MTVGGQITRLISQNYEDRRRIKCGAYERTKSRVLEQSRRITCLQNQHDELIRSPLQHVDAVGIICYTQPS